MGGERAPAGGRRAQNNANPTWPVAGTHGAGEKVRVKVPAGTVDSGYPMCIYPPEPWVPATRCIHIPHKQRRLCRSARLSCRHRGGGYHSIRRAPGPGIPASAGSAGILPASGFIASTSLRNTATRVILHTLCVSSSRWGLCYVAYSGAAWWECRARPRPSGAGLIPVPP
jgi:hypothetical protein